MLAYLTEEQPTIHEHAPLDGTLVVPAPDDQAVWAQVAYEAAHHLDATCWIPSRRRRPQAWRSEPLGCSRHIAPTTTVRVQPRTRRASARLCAQRGMSAADLVEELVARERDSALLAAMNEHFAGASARERADLAQERGAWERTMLDGLASPDSAPPNDEAP